MATVMLVDDEPDILQSLETFVGAAIPTARFVLCSNATDALQRLETEPVDLVVSDYKMPGMDGLEFLRRARTLQPETPRLLMTAYPEMDLAIRAINEGRIQHFFIKPLDPDLVLDVLRAFLDERKARRTREQALQRSLEVLRRRAVDVADPRKGPSEPPA